MVLRPVLPPGSSALRLQSPHFPLLAVPSREGCTVSFFKQQRQMELGSQDHPGLPRLHSRPPPTEAGAAHAPWPRLPATSPGADLVAHGFLVLLVGGFQLGSGRADVDL